MKKNSRVKAKMPCSKKFCVALAVKAGEMCRVHAAYPDLRPVELAPDEELIAGVFGQCEDCRGSGNCEDCNGSGECGDTCGHGHRCGHECEECDGDGRCATCGGSGFGGVQKRAA